MLSSFATPELCKSMSSSSATTVRWIRPHSRFYIYFYFSPASPHVKVEEIHPVSLIRQTPASKISGLFPFKAKDFVPPAKHMRRPPYAAKLRFEVIDTGVGIAPQFLTEVFEPFSQPLRLKEGPGLGLCVSQRLTQGLGGRISVDSKLNEGSRFWFDLDLPLAYVHPSFHDFF